MNLLEVLEEIKELEKKIHQIIDENKTYSRDGANSYHKNLSLLTKGLKKYNINIKPDLSRRRALIVILQEYFYDKETYPIDIDLDSCYRKARVRFIIRNREIGDFNTPQKVHPKKPREFYEDENYKMRQYKEAIELLAFVPDSFFERIEAIEPFMKIYKDIIDE